MRLGVIGIGHWGQKVAGEYITLLNGGVIKSLMLCDVENSKLMQFNGSVEKCTKFEDLIYKVDAVHICTQNFIHYEIAKKALNRGIHILVEKPMTTDHNQASELIEIAAANDLILQVGHIFRFANAVRKIKELYQDRVFGKPYYFTFVWTHFMPYIKAVDILWDLLPHPLDILNFVTGRWPSNFFGVGRVFRRKDLNEMAFLQAIFDNGVVSNIHLSWLNPIRRRTLEVVGSEKSALVDCITQQIKIYEKNNIQSSITVEVNNTIKDEILNFIEAIKTGKNCFNPSVVGMQNVQMIEKAIVSLT